jgi:hypothetical protein
MIYCTAINWGHGFITHPDKEHGSIQGFPADVWVVADNHGAWVAKVGGTRKTKSEAQALVTAVVDASKTAWDDNNVEGESSQQKIDRIGFKPSDITLP